MRMKVIFVVAAILIGFVDIYYSQEIGKGEIGPAYSILYGVAAWIGAAVVFFFFKNTGLGSYIALAVGVSLMSLSFFDVSAYLVHRIKQSIKKKHEQTVLAETGRTLNESQAKDSKDSWDFEDPLIALQKLENLGQLHLQEKVDLLLKALQHHDARINQKALELYLQARSGIVLTDEAEIELLKKLVYSRSAVFQAALLPLLWKVEKHDPELESFLEKLEQSASPKVSMLASLARGANEKLTPKLFDALEQAIETQVWDYQYRAFQIALQKEQVPADWRDFLKRYSSHEDFGYAAIAILFKSKFADLQTLKALLELQHRTQQDRSHRQSFELVEVFSSQQVLEEFLSLLTIFAEKATASEKCLIIHFFANYQLWIPRAAHVLKKIKKEGSVAIQECFAQYPSVFQGI